MLTFDFAGQHKTLPGGAVNVIWTVQYNTTHYGPTPIGEIQGGCFFDPGGCFYDSFNVGAQSFANAPYAGVDVSEDVAWGKGHDFGDGGLAPSSGWLGFRPVAEIITK